MTADDIIIDGKQFYLLEHQEFHKAALEVILNAYGRLIADECMHGFDAAVKQRIRESLKPPEPVIPAETHLQKMFMQQRKRMEVWQQNFENGEYLRDLESGTEANYDQIDGRVNNQKKEKENSDSEQKKTEKKQEQKEQRRVSNKPKQRLSVIKRPREKQVAIAVRDGKPVPKYLEQIVANAERSRR